MPVLCSVALHPVLPAGSSVSPRRGARRRSRGGADALVRGAVLLVADAGAAGVACAEDVPVFDRPRIGFASTTPGRGREAWEQAFFDGRYDRDGDLRSTEDVADSRLRIGLSARTQLQLAIDSQVWQRVRGGQELSGHRGGDASIGLKHVLPSADDVFTWAPFGSAGLPVGRAPYGDAGHRYDLGMGGGEDEMRALGSGVTWLFAERAQLNLSVPCGLSAQTLDWQGGIGISVLLR